MFKKLTSSLGGGRMLFEQDGGGNGGAGGTGLPVWHEQLEGSLKGNEALSGFKGVSELATAYLETGKKAETLQRDLEGRVAIPGEDAPPEERAQFLQKLGMPESPEQYGITPLEYDVPDGFMATADEMKQSSAVIEADFRKMAHEAGLSDKAAKAVYDWYGRIVQQGMNELTELRSTNKQESLDALKKEHGGEWNVVLEKAVRTAEKLAPDGFKENFLEKTDAGGLKFVGDDPHLIALFHHLSTIISDDSILASGEGRHGGGQPRRKGLDFPNSKMPAAQT